MTIPHEAARHLSVVGLNSSGTEVFCNSIYTASNETITHAAACNDDIFTSLPKLSTSLRFRDGTGYRMRCGVRHSDLDSGVVIPSFSSFPNQRANGSENVQFSRISIPHTCPIYIIWRQYYGIHTVLSCWPLSSSRLPSQIWKKSKDRALVQRQDRPDSRLHRRQSESSIVTLITGFTKDPI